MVMMSDTVVLKNKDNFNNKSEMVISNVVTTLTVIKCLDDWDSDAPHDGSSNRRVQKIGVQEYQGKLQRSKMKYQHL